MSRDENTLTEPVSAKDHAEGPAKAPITLVEYGDYECPACGAAYPALKEVQEKMGENLRFVFRNFPLKEMHPHAFAAAEAAEAASAQSKFWEMHDMLYEHQDDLEPEALVSYAEALGLDINRFVKDVNEGKFTAKIKHDFQTGVMSGVNGTPSLFINGERYDGSFDAETLLEVLQAVAIESGGSRTKAIRR
jgi:protein-disulfide isomerase